MNRRARWRLAGWLAFLLSLIPLAYFVITDSDASMRQAWWAIVVPAVLFILMMFTDPSSPNQDL